MTLTDGGSFAASVYHVLTRRRLRVAQTKSVVSVSGVLRGDRFERNAGASTLSLGTPSVGVVNDVQSKGKRMRDAIKYREMYGCPELLIASVW